MTATRKSTGVAIIGVGESDLGIVPGRSSHSLYAQAINEAIGDARLKKSDIDGLITLDSYVTKRTRHAMSVAQYVGLRSESMRFISTSMHGSMSSSGIILQEAMMAIRSGVCNYVVVAGGDNFASMGRAQAITRMSENRDGEFESPFGTFIVGTFAMIARRYMADFGATEDDFAEVAVAQRSWANLHPKAQMRGVKITKADVLASPMIATPFRRLNAPIISDGGNAMVLTSVERAKEYGDRAVTLLASEGQYGTGRGHVSDDLGQLESLYSLREGSALATHRALANAGVSAKDFDVYFSYDPFSIVTLLYLEALGVCGVGEAADFIKGGTLAPGGTFPWNTHGGLHSYCHPGTNGGMYHLIEAVRQLRGDAELRQVVGAKLALMQGYGANKGGFNASVLLRGMP